MAYSNLLNIRSANFPPLCEARAERPKNSAQARVFGCFLAASHTIQRLWIHAAVVPFQTKASSGDHA
jgi:hypothetical protein